jgi:hypothetical protein
LYTIYIKDFTSAMGSIHEYVIYVVQGYIEKKSIIYFLVL